MCSGFLGKTLIFSELALNSESKSIFLYISHVPFSAALQRSEPGGRRWRSHMQTTLGSDRAGSLNVRENNIVTAVTRG
jgi:hypothetical protein